MGTPSQSDDGSDSGDDLSDTLLVLPLLRQLLSVQVEEAGEDAESPPDSLLREEAGARLWDVSAGRKQSTVLVEKGSFLLVFPSLVEQSVQAEDFRMAEILLGILGNILTHRSLASKAAEEKDVIICVLNCVTACQDAIVIAEALRVINAALVNEGYRKWLDAITAFDDIVPRLHWLLDNTLNEFLMERLLATMQAIASHDSTLGAALVASGPLLQSCIDLVIKYSYCVLPRELQARRETPSWTPSQTIAESALRVLEVLVGLEAAETTAKECHGQMCDLCTLLIRHSEGGRVAVGAAVLLCEICDYREIDKLALGPIFIERLLEALLDADDEKGRNAVWFLVAAVEAGCHESQIVEIIGGGEVLWAHWDPESVECVMACRCIAAKFKRWLETDGSTSGEAAVRKAGVEETLVRLEKLLDPGDIAASDPD